MPRHGGGMSTPGVGNVGRLRKCDEWVFLAVRDNLCCARPFTTGDSGPCAACPGSPGFHLGENTVRRLKIRRLRVREKVYAGDRGAEGDGGWARLVWDARSERMQK